MLHHPSPSPRSWTRRTELVLAALLVVGLCASLTMSATGAGARPVDDPAATGTSASSGVLLSRAVPVRALVRGVRAAARHHGEAVRRQIARERAQARQLRAEQRAEARAQRRARAAAQRRARQRRAERVAASAPISLRVGSFNVLGSQHSGPGGSRSSFPAASARTPQAAALVNEHGIDILGAQELQADQLRGMQSRTGMAAYPGFGWGEAETDNSILYDPRRFELVEGSRFTITFMGRPRPQPIARFRDLASGREFYVVNTHPSAGEGRYATERSNGRDALVSVVNGLRDSGLPVLVTGDMNDREAFYCAAAPRTGMTASNGGSYGAGCQPPPQPLPVDWVVGRDVDWSGYWRDTRPVQRRISDHFLISAEARLR